MISNVSVAQDLPPTVIPPLEQCAKQHKEEISEKIDECVPNEQLRKRLKKCSYEDGYKNQQVYSCKTWYIEKLKDGGITDPDQINKILVQIDAFNYSNWEVQPFGVWVGCMTFWHEGHEMFELYGKANFRCDCGNSKMNSYCYLQDDKDFENADNRYSHNFFGKYCHCNKEYHGEEGVYQCNFWEDWFHSDCLKPKATEKMSELDKQDVEWILMCRMCWKSYGSLLEAYTEDILNYDNVLNIFNDEEKDKWEQPDDKDKPLDVNNDSSKANAEDMKIKTNKSPIKRKHKISDLHGEEDTPETLNLKIPITNEEMSDGVNKLDEGINKPAEKDENLVDKSQCFVNQHNLKMLTCAKAQKVVPNLLNFDLLLPSNFSEKLWECDKTRWVNFKHELTKVLEENLNFSDDESILEKALNTCTEMYEQQKDHIQENPLYMPESQEEPNLLSAEDISNIKANAKSSTLRDSAGSLSETGRNTASNEEEKEGQLNHEELWTSDSKKLYPEVTTHKRFEMFSHMKNIIGKETCLLEC